MVPPDEDDDDDASTDDEPDGDEGEADDEGDGSVEEAPSEEEVAEEESEEEGSEEEEAEPSDEEEAEPEEDEGEASEEEQEAEEEASEEEQEEEEASEEEEEEPTGEVSADAEAGADADLEAEYELPELDADVFGSRDEYPDATDDDFEDDAGDWSLDDYLETAKAFFGGHAFFGDTAHQRYLDQGFTPFADAARLMSLFEQHVPELSGAVTLYEKDGRVVPRGIITSVALAALEVAFPDLDLSKLNITVPKRPRLDDDGGGDAPRAPQGLPAALAGVTPGDKVDLRKHASPVGDQGSTSRCAAFAWTHAREMLGNILGRPVPRLACSFTMLQFQELQGDKKDFAYAFKGGDGTSGTWQPGKHLMENGTCREELWPNDKKHPHVSVDEMRADARNHAIDADVYDISVEDMRKVLSAGFPVQLSIATGDAFQDIGRDGVMKSAESPKGQHGYHAMLCVGYVGNYFIVKNSWGEDWGDAGYCYIPKAVLLKSEPEPVAVIPKRAPGAPPAGQGRRGPTGTVPPEPPARAQGPSRAAPSSRAVPFPGKAPRPQQPSSPPQQQQQQQPPRAAPPAPEARSVTCPRCGAAATGRFCAACGSPLAAPPPAPAKKFCTECGGRLAPGAKFCASCGGRVG